MIIIGLAAGCDARPDFGHRRRPSGSTAQPANTRANSSLRPQTWCYPGAVRAEIAGFCDELKVRRRVRSRPRYAWQTRSEEKPANSRKRTSSSWIDGEKALAPLYKDAGRRDRRRDDTDFDDEGTGSGTPTEAERQELLNWAQRTSKRTGPDLQSLKKRWRWRLPKQTPPPLSAEEVSVSLRLSRVSGERPLCPKLRCPVILVAAEPIETWAAYCVLRRILMKLSFSFA
jgi:hypothetical protein